MPSPSCTTRTIAGGRSGDANNDGVVDSKDAAALAANWLSDRADWSMGDFNGDNRVDDRDAAILSANWLSTAATASVSLPEPSIFILMATLLAKAGVLYRR